MPPQRKGIVKSGNAGNSSKKDPKPQDSTKSDELETKPLFPPGFKTPLSLLNERCQQLGWNKPNVEPRKHGDGFTCSITLYRDHKSERESIRFVPHPLLSRPTAIEAKHWGATYALHRFSNNLQLHRLLPPGPREYWAELEATRKAAPEHQAWMYDPDPFAAKKMVEQRQATAKRKIEKEEQGGKALRSGSSEFDQVPEVRMATSMRDSVEKVIKEVSFQYPGVVMDDTAAQETPSFNKIEVEASLRTQGFQRHQIESALAFISSSASDRSPYLASLLSLPPLEACISYMLLSLPESDLPAQFKSQQATSDPFVRGGNLKDIPIAVQWLASRAIKEGGWPEGTVLDVVRSGTTDWGLMVERLGGRLIGSSSEYNSAVGGGQDTSERETKRSEEIDAIRSVYLNAKYDAERAVLSLPLPSDPDTCVNVIYSPLHPYPSMNSRIPPLFVSSPKRSSYVRLHLLSRVLSALGPDGDLELSLMSGEGIMFGAVDIADNESLRIQDSPPEIDDVMKHLVSRSSTTTSSSRDQDRRKPARRQRRPQGDILDDRTDEEIKREFEQSRRSEEYAVMLEARKKLPAWNSQDDIVRLVESSRVIVVVGETGCGKSTQLPQFILDAYINNECASRTNIVITQPRRVSAIGVSARVAAERMGDGSVGYAIRGETKQGRRTKLLFCTTGVLLRRLTTSNSLSGVSHVIVDEVHERSVDGDFLLLELRELLKHNDEIKIILMSATINQRVFVEYFNGAPVLEIPGFTYPVQDIYLEDLVPKLDYSPLSAKSVPKQTEEELRAFREEFEAIGLGAQSIRAIENFTRLDRLDYQLISKVVSHIVETAEDPEGAILIFLTGVQEIRQCTDILRTSSIGNSADILPLHANLASDEQRRVFTKTKKRKIVIATNVAETSITIPEVVYVVDCGKVKETQYDVGAGLSRLVETWITKAAAKQRRGRAGRTRPGKCYKLFTRKQEAVMKAFPVPEMLRVPLEALSLQIKVMRENEDVRLFLAKALDPPKVEAMDKAWNILGDLGAVDSEGELTALGRQMALLPVDLRLGKMMILGAIFRCLDPILTVAACVSSKPLFLSPMDKKEEATRARLQFATANSDLLTDVNAYNKCRAFREEGNTQSAQRRFMEENFISPSTIRDITSLRQDFLAVLSDIGFIPLKSSASSPLLNVNSENTNLVKAIILGGLWPRVARISMPKATFDQVASGSVQRDYVAKEIKIFDKSEGRVFLHPNSVLFGNASYKSPYLTYFSMTATSKTFLRDATEIPLYALLLFGGQVTINHMKGGVTVGNGGWIRMRAWSRIGVLVNQLRLLLDAQLQESIEHAEIADVGEDNPVIQAMLDLITKDGLAGS